MPGGWAPSSRQMSEAELNYQMEPSDIRMREIRERLQRLEHRDWWLWWAAVVVMLLLTVAVVSLSFPAFLATEPGVGSEEAFFRFHLSQAVRGLVALVLVFNIYTVYQQILIKRLRKQLAEQIEMLAKLQMRVEEFHRLAVLDPLTGLYNRRFAEQRLGAEVARAERRGQPLTVLVLDLDDFKQINDRHGHAAGDEVLKFFGERLVKASRGSDLAVRMGGDEFMAVLPECSPEQVDALVARLTPLEMDYGGKKIAITFSAGRAGHVAGESAAALCERADQALYAGKRAQKTKNVAVESE